MLRICCEKEMRAAKAAFVECDVDVSGMLSAAEAQEAVASGYTGFKLKARPWWDVLEQVEAVDQVADMVGDVAGMQFLPPLVSGIDHLHQVVGDPDHGVIVRQRRVAEVIDRADLAVRRDDLFGHVEQPVLAGSFRSHGGSLWSWASTGVVGP